MSFALATIAAMILPALLLIGIFLFLGRRITAAQRMAWNRREWGPYQSAERYRPMFRLLDDGDICFLLSQPGVTPEMVRRVRRQRCEVFRGYLRSLERDFQLTSEALILLMIQSRTDRRDLLWALIGSQARFATGVFTVRCRLMLYRWNIGEEPVIRLVSIFESLQREVQRVLPTLQPVA